ncbi:Glyoxalase/Bleomycin resistance protein/Dihydroxybiphenyl dioxygenase [Geranomyces variabilis]|nr:Glyoxalase/Bleomycin resistance protein/Dihydroxybiphenyl dioxygenase [Geranomyces variabilis]
MTTDTKTYEFNHTMYRVQNPEASLKFYTELLGMSLICKLDFEEAKFSLYFLGYNVPAQILAASQDEKRKYAFSRPGVLELTHNWEHDESFKGYCSGNEDAHKGYGHIGLTVDNVEAAVERLEKAGVKIQKRPNSGKMSSIAFVLDPDGTYSILPCAVWIHT